MPSLIMAILFTLWEMYQTRQKRKRKPKRKPDD